MDRTSFPGIYGTSPCSGCSDGSAPAAQGVPSIEDIAGYSQMTPQQQDRQRQQLYTLGEQAFGGRPFPLRNAAPSPGGMFPSAAGQTSFPQTTGTQVPAAGQQIPDTSLSPITPTTEPAPVSGDSLQYLNGFLRTQIGRPVRVEFLIGTNTLVDRTGILLGVGANYILINEANTDDVVACDFYNIKFVQFFY